MTPEDMIEIINDNCSDVVIDENIIEFKYDKSPVTLIFNENYDRMRLMCAIVFRSDLKEDHLMKAMEANFYYTLDVKYALSSGIFFSVFMHPIEDLSEKLFLSALDQVVNAKRSFGSKFSNRSNTSSSHDCERDGGAP